MVKYFKIINRIRGGNALWSNSSPASVILNNDFFGVQESSGTIYDAVLTLSSSHLASTLSDASVNASVVLIQDAIASMQNLSNMIGVVVLSSDHAVSNQNNVLIGVNASLNSDFGVGFLTKVDIFHTIDLSQNATIFNSKSLALNEFVALSFANSMLLLDTVESNNSISLNLDVVNELTDNLDFLNALTIDSVGEIATEPSVSLSAIISLSSDGVASISSFVNINLVALLDSDSELNNAVLVSMNGDMSLQTSSSMLDNAGGDYLKNIVLLTDNNVEFTYEAFSDVVIQLFALSQVSISNHASLLSQIALMMNNQVLFDAFYEIYSNTVLASEAEMLVGSEVLKIINELFSLNLDSQTMFEVEKLLNDGILLSVTAFVEFIIEVVTVDYSQNEIIQLNSLITNNLLFKSMITVLLLKNTVITSQISTSSFIINTIEFNSEITNTINLKSKIK